MLAMSGANQQGQVMQKLLRPRLRVTGKNHSGDMTISVVAETGDCERELLKGALGGFVRRGV